MTRRAGRPRGTRAVVLALLILSGSPHETRASCTSAVRYYGTWSLGRKAGPETVPLERRVDEVRGLGANMVVGIGGKKKVLDLLPDGMLAVPGCSLMKKRDWQTDGRWDEAKARKRLAKLGRRYDDNPRVYGACITHEVTEYADHARRVWMYRLAKQYFPDKKVIQYYGVLTDTLNPAGVKVDGYGKNGERETDVLFVSLPAVAKGHFSGDNVRRLRDALAAAARTPGVPVWGQTSINADNKIVTGPESMTAIWGEHGENMSVWTDILFETAGPDTPAGPLRLTGFFWRSLGRFPWDLGYPAFADHRARMRAIGQETCARS
ncbi:MAG: hypothetical protein E6J79_10355 [Deltaproteobacteria bacterium]|nr:MAG: hypothetical protein E6J79_10355 [Deltaproteobacteria bacterium]